MTNQQASYIPSGEVSTALNAWYAELVQENYTSIREEEVLKKADGASRFFQRGRIDSKLIERLRRKHLMEEAGRLFDQVIPARIEKLTKAPKILEYDLRIEKSILRYQMFLTEVANLKGRKLNPNKITKIFNKTLKPEDFFFIHKGYNQLAYGTAVEKAKKRTEAGLETNLEENVLGLTLEPMYEAIFSENPWSPKSRLKKRFVN